MGKDAVDRRIPRTQAVLQHALISLILKKDYEAITVYHILSRCTRRRLVDYPNLWAYARDLYVWRGVADITDFNAIREGAYTNDLDNNPVGIIAVAPDVDWKAPHGRERLGNAQVALRSGELVEVEPATLRGLRG